jgi:3-deoxy-7-phosphoheptulonate synthase
MNYTLLKKLPSIETILQEIPLHDQYFQKIHQDRQEIKDILSGNDPRLLLIVGPCSAWPSEAVLDYAKKLQSLNQQLSGVMKIVMRVYIQKSRTTKGWTGPVNQPDPLREPDIEAGMRYVRKLMVEVIRLGLPIADEALFTHNAKGFLELLSWVAIGARSAEDPEHRIFASSLDCPVGLKNPTHGSLRIGVNGIIAAQHPHVAVFDGHAVQTHGNPYAHLVLRGGNGRPNYALPYLQEVATLMNEEGIENPALIIDASHDNCLHEGKKDPSRQGRVIQEVLDTIQEDRALKKLVKGFMIESFIHEGNQQVDPRQPDQLNRSGLSITDPCLGWEATELLLIQLAERLACRQSL